MEILYCSLQLFHCLLFQPFYPLTPFQLNQGSDYLKNVTHAWRYSGYSMFSDEAPKRSKLFLSFCQMDSLSSSIDGFVHRIANKHSIAMSPCKDDGYKNR